MQDEPMPICFAFASAASAATLAASKESVGRWFVAAIVVISRLIVLRV